MKILYLHQHFATPKMGGITRSYEFARRLVAQGHEVHLITADQSINSLNKRVYETVEAGIHVHWLPVPYNNKMGFYGRIVAFLRYVLLASRLATRIGGDIIYASSPPLTIALPAIFTSKQLKIPLVLEVRDLWPELPIAFGALKNPCTILLARWLEHYAYINSSHIIALSPGMKLGIINQGYPPEKITVIPNSCDHELFRPHKNDAEVFRSKHRFLGKRPFALYAGTIGEANGVAYIAHLAKAVLKRNSDICFLIIGEGKEAEKVRETAIHLDVLNKNFYMLPSISKYEVSQAMSAASMVLNTLVDKRALWNSSPNKFFDALAAEIPVAINFGGWLANLLQATNAGLVLSPKNFEEAGEQITRALMDPIWITQAKSAAGKLGREQFSREELTKKLHTILLSTAGHSVSSNEPKTRSSS